MSEIPHRMRAVRLEATGQVPELAIREVAVPRPGPGQVLVKMRATPVHRADIRFCRGRHTYERPLPTTPGFEGMGTVVANGGGLVGRWMKGRRVAVLGSERSHGLWAEYAVVEATSALPLWPSVTDEQGATLIIHPMAALHMLDEVRAAGHTAAVQTAAAGTMGQLLTRLAIAEGFAMVHIVRRREQAELLASLGAVSVISSSEDEFEARLRRACREYGVTVALDALGGPITAQLLDAMPDGAEAVVYGFIAGADVSLPAEALVYRRQRLRGFLLSDRLEALGARAMLAAVPRLRRYLGDVLQVPVSRRITLEELPAFCREQEAPRKPGAVIATVS